MKFKTFSLYLFCFLFLSLFQSVEARNNNVLNPFNSCNVELNRWINATYSIENCQDAQSGYLVKGISVNDPEETDIFPTQTIYVNVTHTGAFDITTDYANGIRFRATGTFAVTGIQSVILNAEGTPSNHGTFEYFLEGCSFMRNTYVADRRYKDATLQGQDENGDGGSLSRHHRFIYKIFTSSHTGEEWMQTNLGSYYNKVGHPDFDPDATPGSVSDINAFGSVFQWGRYSDGHELINWSSGTENVNEAVNPTTTETVIGNVAEHNKMVLAPQWQQNPNSDLWQGERGLNNPCPKGFRVPLQSEYTKESTLYEFQTIQDAFNSDFQIVGPGARKHLDGLFENGPGVQSVYWTSGLQNQNNSYDYHFQATVYEHSTVRGFAFCVRCVLLKYEFSHCKEGTGDTEEYSLSEIISVIASDYPEYDISFYDTYDNAFQGLIQGQYNQSVTIAVDHNPNIIFARLSDSSGTVDVIKVAINLHIKPQVEDPSVLQYCTSIGSTIGLYDLTSIQDQIVETQEGLTFGYYETLEGAENEVLNLKINSPSYYSGPSGVVYVRIQNEYECGYVVKPIPLTIVQQTINSQDINIPVICTLDSSINLEQYIDELVQGQNYFGISFYHTELSAQNGDNSNVIESPESFVIPFYNQEIEIFVRVNQYEGINCNPVISKLTLRIGKIPELFLDEDPVLNVCSGNNVLLELSTDADTIYWYDEEDSQNNVHVGLQYLVPELTENRSYWIEASKDSCLSDRIEIYVKVSEIPDISLNQNHFEICQGNEIDLKAFSNNGEVYWYESQDAQLSIHVGESFVVSSVSESFSIWVEAMNESNCSSERLEIKVDINPTPELIIENEYLEICSGGDALLKAESINGEIQWFSEKNDQEQISIGNEFLIDSLEESTSYWVQAYDLITGCTSEKKEITINVLETPNIVVDFAYDLVCKPSQSVLPILPIDFSHGGTFSSDPDLDINPDTGEINAGSSKIGSYWVTYSIDKEDLNCGYKSEHKSLITVAMCYIPKGISPDGDGFNDFLDLTGMGIVKITIFNRYGKEVYSSSHYEKEWYGQDGVGKELPEGSYFYSILTSIGEEMTGYIYLSRSSD